MMEWINVMGYCLVWAEIYIIIGVLYWRVERQKRELKKAKEEIQILQEGMSAVLDSTLILMKDRNAQLRKDLEENRLSCDYLGEFLMDDWKKQHLPKANRRKRK